MLSTKKKSKFKNRIRKAKRDIRVIITKYKSFDRLKKCHAHYKKLIKNKKCTQKYKDSNASFAKFKRLSKNIKDMEIVLSRDEENSSRTVISFSSDSENSDVSTLNEGCNEIPSQQTDGEEGLQQLTDNSENLNSNQEEEVQLQCHNCKRKQHHQLIEKYGVDSHYVIAFSTVSSYELHRRKFKHVDIITNQNGIEYTLCSNCERYLTIEDDYNKEVYCWPSFLIHVLENESIHEQYGNLIWRYIPLQYRYWWLEYLQVTFPEVFHDVTLTCPTPALDDVTIKLEKWKKYAHNLKETKLSDLGVICNELLFPTVMCPWGDSVFIHKCGSVSLDSIFQRYLMRCELKLIGCSDLSKVKWTRDDYFRDDGDDDVWLFNPTDWKVRPSIAFIDGTPRFLTCCDHDNGSKDIMIHTCRWEHCLPCYQPDQIAQVVVQSRTVRRGKASAYSNEWQMFEQRGSFGGIDTCNHVEYGKFDKNSLLRHEVENRAIHNRLDVNLHLDTLCKHKIISSEMVNDMRNCSYHFSNERNYEPLYRGATYVPLHAAVMFQNDNNNHRNIKITHTSSDGNPNHNITIKFNRYWPTLIYPCQKYSKHGVQVNVVPSFRGGIENKIIWQIACIMTQVEPVWKFFVEAISDANDWFGWFLCYFTKHCLNVKYYQHRYDPFKLNQIRSMHQLRGKIPNNMFLFDLIADMENISCIETDDFDHRSIDVNIHDISIEEENDTVIIMSKGPLDIDYINVLKYLDTFDYGDVKYELLCEVIIEENGSRWSGDIFTRHGGFFNKYWYQSRNSNFPIMKEPPQSLEIGKEYIFIYINRKKSNFDTVQNQYLKLLGGQSHVQCRTHKCPLITSYKKEEKCTCGKRSNYCCTNINCSLHICKECFNGYNPDTVSMVTPPLQREDNIEEDDESMRDDTFVQDDNESEEFEGISEDILANYVTISEEQELLVNDAEMLVGDNISEDEDEMIIPTEFIPTTDAGVLTLEVEEKVQYGFKFAGSNILNNVGSLLSRSGHDFQKSRYVNHNIQKLCSVANCECIPLLYPEGMLFPSIHWMSSSDNCSIIGAIPSSLLNEHIHKEGFATVQQHVRTRLTCPSCATNSDPRYITHCYDIMANLAASQNDTRLVINRGLTVAKDKYGNLGVRGGSGDSSLLGSVDSKQMVKNLCSSQKKTSWSFFLTFTANQSRHPGLKPLRNWLETKGWRNVFPGYCDLTDSVQKEIDDAINQAAAGLMLRIWEETSKIFLDYLTQSKNSPYRNVKATFSRREYQSNSGNLSHAHIIIAVNWDALTVEERDFVNNLARGSVYDVVRSHEIPDYIDQELINSQDDVCTLVDDATIFLTHKCNNRCLVKTSDGGFRCRMPRYMNMTPDCTKQHFIELPVIITEECWSRLNKIGLANPVFDYDGNKNKFESSLGFFHPKRWIPAVVPGEALLSPFESQTFCVCQSMQNCQRLDQAGGCCKYTCKYLGKVDKQNYITVTTNKDNKGGIQTNSTYLHNTKVTTSDMQQMKEKNEKRGAKHPEGRCVALTEMIHVMLQYPEVYTDLVFVSISTLPLELRSSAKITTDMEIEDGVYTTSVSSHVRSVKDLPEWRRHTENESIIMSDIQQSGMRYDKITQFSLRPPEIKTFIGMVGDYYRWFYVDMAQKIAADEMMDLVNEDVNKTSWIDGLQRKVKLRFLALNEIIEYCDTFDEGEISHETESMLSMIRNIHRVFTVDFCTLNDDDQDFFYFANNELIHRDESQKHLPVPVFSYVKPFNPIQFINHILLSMGNYFTEIDLMMHTSMRECFRNAGLIGNSENPEELQRYSNELLKKYITEQVRYFPNSMRAINSFIVMAGIVFDQAIVQQEIAITDMPAVQFSLLAKSMMAEMIMNRRNIVEKTIDAVFLELGDLVETCNMPSKQELLNVSIENKIEWDPVESFVQGDNQTLESYHEQRVAIETCKKSIDSYVNVTEQTIMTKSVIVRGHPGAGKTFCMLYMIAYAISQGLMITTTAKMSHRSLQLGGTNWDKMLCLRGNEDNVNAYRRAELAIARIKKNRKKEDVLLSMHVIFADELGQISAEEFSVYDIILRNIRGSSTFMGGILLIGTLDHLQIQPINGRPFLTASVIIPCFKMIALKHSVRAVGSEYVELQSLVRKDYVEFDNNPDLLVRFREICSKIFTFVDSWDDDRITSQTFRVFSKKVPAKTALKDFQSKLQNKYRENPSALPQRKSEDSQKSRYCHDWLPAEKETSEMLDKKCREPQLLLFEVGLIYTCTFNDNKKSNSQKAILFDLPNQNTLNEFSSIKVLLAPPGCKDISFDQNTTKESLLARGFVETTIACAPHKICILPNNLQGVRKQFGLQHYIAGTIHSIMGDTLPSIATTISDKDRNFSVWDKGQLLVIISRTKLAEDTIFVGDKESTLNAMVSILLVRTQWTDYMETILRVITTNYEEENNDSAPVRATMTHSSFPYRMNDVFLPTDCSGYVYMLISLRLHDYYYIGKTRDLHQRMRSHQSGHGSRSTQPEHLRPYAYFAYICGFNGNEAMMFYIEDQWKRNINRLLQHGINDPKSWARRGGEDVLNLDLSNFGVEDTRSELRLVLLYK